MPENNSYKIPNEIENIFEKIEVFIEEGSFHDAKQCLLSLHNADIADLLEKISEERRQRIIDILNEDLDPEILVLLDHYIKLSVFNILGPKQTARNIEKLDIEDAIDILEDLENAEREEILEFVSKKRKIEISEALNYPEECAGRIMEKNYLNISENLKISQAIKVLKSRPNTRDYHSSLIVTGARGNIIGTLSIMSLLKAQDDEYIRDITEKDIHVVEVETPSGEVTYLFKHYSLNIIPVINKKKKLVGAISLANIIYIIDEQAEEDIMHLGGVSEKDIYSKLSESVRQRFPWLFVNLIIAFITSRVIGLFESTITATIALASVMPIVASLGGNAGTQTVTVAVRSIASKDLTSMNYLKVVLKEMLTCCLNGIVIGALGGLALFPAYHDFHLSLIFFFAVLINFCVAGFCGSSIPIIFFRLKIDPALASGVFLTALTDIVGFFIFLAMAKFFI